MGETKKRQAWSTVDFGDINLRGKKLILGLKNVVEYFIGSISSAAVHTKRG